MVAFFVHLVVTALLLIVVSYLIRGVEVKGFGAALVAALVLGLANAFVRPLVVLFTLPATIVTLGLFLLVINALMLMLVSAVVPGFRIRSFGSAFFGSIVLALLNFGIDRLVN